MPDVGESLRAGLICHQTAKGLTEVSSLPLNVDMTSFSKLYAGWVSRDQQGLLIDGYDGQYMTSELLFIRNNRFSLPYVKYGDFYSDVMRRSGAVYSRDVDGDGIPEVPVQRSAPGKTGLYFTNYCQVGEDLELQPVATAFVNESFGYTFRLPEKWKDKVTAFENDAGEIVFAQYDPETETMGHELMRIRVYSEKDYQDKFDIESYHRIGQRGNFRYYASTPGGDELSLTAGQVRALFEIM
jgi:hypothetical protein